MLGWLSLIKAEDLSYDLTSGDGWRESVRLQPFAGTFESSGTEYEVTGSVPALTGYILYADLPFRIISELAPEYIIDRMALDLIASDPNYYALNDADQRDRFDGKRARLLEAFHRLCALEGYALTAETLPEPNLQSAQLLCAINAANDTGIGFYAVLQSLGVKRDRRGKAETEFFSNSDRISADVQGVANEVLNLIKAYEIPGEYGLELEA